jgi:hypothetical protein
VDLCAPLKKIPGLPANDQCPSGTRGE